jgi:hypothetical protein
VDALFKREAIGHAHLLNKRQSCVKWKQLLYVMEPMTFLNLYVAAAAIIVMHAGHNAINCATEH